LPPAVEPCVGDALDAASVAQYVPIGGTVVHLVGTPHPSPAKAAEFRRVDLESARAAFAAAGELGAAHIVYVSVARPAPIMRVYQAVRAEAEAMLAAVGIPATVLRPWYVLGPGHRWPIVLIPLYAAASLVPGLRDGAERLGLVTVTQMVEALVRAVEDPPTATRVWDVPMIRG
jgi:uncharacterized protein YbjT (DUF2867 family)